MRAEGCGASVAAVQEEARAGDQMPVAVDCAVWTEDGAQALMGLLSHGGNAGCQGVEWR